MVQALLITRRMLFVGFGFDDQNFHRIVDEVRKAVRSDGATNDGTFGTALFLQPDAMRIRALAPRPHLHWH